MTAHDSTIWKEIQMPGPNSNPAGGKTAFEYHKGKSGSSEQNPAYKRLQLRIAGYEEATKTAATQYHRPGSLSGRK